MTAKIVVVPPTEIESIWGVIFPHLKPAIDEDLFTDEESLKKQLIEDRALMFVALVDDVVKGACVTTIENPRFKVVNIMTLGGDDFAEWKDVLNDALTVYAKTISAAYIVALGREAWQRLWPDFEAGKRLYTKRIAA